MLDGLYKLSHMLHRWLWAPAWQHRSHKVAAVLVIFCPGLQGAGLSGSSAARHAPATGIMRTCSSSLHMCGVVHVQAATSTCPVCASPPAS